MAKMLRQGRRTAPGDWVAASGCVKGPRFYSTRFRLAGDGGETLDNDGVIYPVENIW